MYILKATLLKNLWFNCHHINVFVLNYARKMYVDTKAFNDNNRFNGYIRGKISTFYTDVNNLATIRKRSET